MEFTDEEILFPLTGYLLLPDSIEGAVYLKLSTLISPMSDKQQILPSIGLSAAQAVELANALMSAAEKASKSGKIPPNLKN